MGCSRMWRSLYCANTMFSIADICMVICGRVAGVDRPAALVPVRSAKGIACD